MATANTSSSFFPSFSCFAASVMYARNGPVDRRLVVAAAAPSTFGSEGVGSDGGFVVAPEFSKRIFSAARGEASIASRCTNVETSAFAIHYPADLSAPWAGNPTPAWKHEGGQLTASKLNLASLAIPLRALRAYVPASEELISDVGPLFDDYFSRTFSAKATYLINDAIINGDGVVKPSGLVTAPGTVTVSKESAQSGTFTVTNARKMAAALYPQARVSGDAMWIMSPSALAGIEETGAGPSGSRDYSGPRPRLFGIEIWESDAAQPLGTAGDVVLFAPSTIIVASRVGDPSVAASIGLFWDSGQRAYRASWRMNALSTWSSTIAAPKGSAVYGNAVVLQSRP